MAGHAVAGPSTAHATKSHQSQSNVIKTMILVSAFCAFSEFPMNIHYLLFNIHANLANLTVLECSYYAVLFSFCSIFAPTHSFMPSTLNPSNACCCVCFRERRIPYNLLKVSRSLPAALLVRQATDYDQSPGQSCAMPSLSTSPTQSARSFSYRKFIKSILSAEPGSLYSPTFRQIPLSAVP